MANEISSIEELRKKAASEDIAEEVTGEVVETAAPEVDKTADVKSPKKGMTEEDYVKLAIEREEKAKMQSEKEKEEAQNRKRLEDGREYEYEVAGFNIGDAIMRRAHTIDNNGKAMSEALEDARMEKEIEDEEKTTDDQLNESESFEDDLDESLANENDSMFSTADETPKKKAYKAKEEKIENDTLPTQEELDIDDEDISDIDLDEDEEDDADFDDDDSLNQKEMEALREAIKEKLNMKDTVVGVDGTAKISANKSVSLNDVLSVQSSSAKVIDYPLMSAGRCVSMREFSGTEIEALNQGTSGRNRFNTLKTIYHSLYDHIVDKNKPEFDKWLKVTSFADIDHLYMAAYKASFNGANYIPYTCDKCEHLFLSDDIDIESMIKFKDEAAKKKFHDILENSDMKSKEDSCIYQTQIIPISSNIAIGFREPSIYNTVFENSVLDQKFVDKYTKLLTIMVYIDNIYLIQNGEYIPVRLKVDKYSVAKTAKYRIVSYAKIIRNLPSDCYNKIIGEIAKINTLLDEVKYQLPEMTCPKCGETIEAQEEQATALLFSRHQLSLLTQEF